jgi:hypothetical protein
MASASALIPSDWWPSSLEMRMRGGKPSF